MHTPDYHHVYTSESSLPSTKYDGWSKPTLAEQSIPDEQVRTCRCMIGWFTPSIPHPRLRSRKECDDFSLWQIGTFTHHLRTLSEVIAVDLAMRTLTIPTTRGASTLAQVSESTKAHIDPSCLEVYGKDQLKALTTVIVR